jgi:hypothetical protein
MAKNRAILGQHNVIDDITGLKRKSGDMRMLDGEQKSLITHFRDWEPPQPQLDIKGREDKQQVKHARVRPEPTFVTNTTQDDL